MEQIASTHQILSFDEAFNRCFTGGGTKEKSLVEKAINFINQHKVLNKFDIGTVGFWEDVGTNPSGHTQFSNKIQSCLPGFSIGTQYNLNGEPSADLDVRSPIFRIYFANNDIFNKQIIIALPWNLIDSDAFRSHVDKFIENTDFKKKNYTHFKGGGVTVERANWLLFLNEQNFSRFTQVMDVISKNIIDFHCINKRLIRKPLIDRPGLRFATL